MRFKCEVRELKSGIATAVRAISANAPLPILQMLNVTADADGLTLLATDYEKTITCRVAAAVEEPGGLAVPAKQFGEIVARFAASEVAVTEEAGGRLVLKGGRSTYKLAGVAVEEYPSVPEVIDPNGIELPQGMLRDMIQKVLYAAATDRGRPILTGALLEIGGDAVKMVATDAHRMGCYFVPVEGLAAALSVIIPRETLTELLHFLGRDNAHDVRLRLDDSQVQFESPFGSLTSRVLAGPFPKYEAIFPESFDWSVTVEREPWIDVLKRLSVVAKDALWQCTRLEFGPDLLRLSSRVQETEAEGIEEMGCQFEGEPGTVTHLNAGYLLEALQAFDSDLVILQGSGPNRALMLCPGDSDRYMSLLMPVTAGS